MHARLSIYLTFGQWGVQAALDISNFRPLKVNVFLSLIYVLAVI